MGFKFERFPVQGPLLIKPDVFGDARGYFKETYKRSIFLQEGIDQNFVQDNFSYSTRGVLRGLHFQLGDHAQGKLVSVALGKVWDVAVDIRKSSPTFGQWIGVELTSENHEMFWIPPGFAHGFVVVSETAIFQYKCTDEYHKASEGGVIWNDPQIGITWPLTDVLVSDKDKILPVLSQAQVFS